MTTLDNIDVPEAAIQALDSILFYDAMQTMTERKRRTLTAAIRAALQAWVDCGKAKMAKLDMFLDGPEWEAGSEWRDSRNDRLKPALILRLDAITKEPEHE